jgi:hypothetical protein
MEFEIMEKKAEIDKLIYHWHSDQYSNKRFLFFGFARMVVRTYPDEVLRYAYHQFKNVDYYWEQLVALVCLYLDNQLLFNELLDDIVLTMDASTFIPVISIILKHATPVDNRYTVMVNDESFKRRFRSFVWRCFDKHQKWLLDLDHKWINLCYVSAKYTHMYELYGIVFERYYTLMSSEAFYHRLVHWMFCIDIIIRGLRAVGIEPRVPKKIYSEVFLRWKATMCPKLLWFLLGEEPRLQISCSDLDYINKKNLAIMLWHRNLRECIVYNLRSDISTKRQKEECRGLFNAYSRQYRMVAWVWKAYYQDHNVLVDVRNLVLQYMFDGELDKFADSDSDDSSMDEE